MRPRAVALIGGVAAAVCALAVGVALPAAAQPVVRTADGLVGGSAEPGLQVFLGVPFARPPLGDLRWRDPQPVQPWSGVRTATGISAACMQAAPAPFGPYTSEFLTRPEMSEDCLYLNVWSPKRRDQPRPVLVFVHGGAFQSGSTSVPIYDGADLARKDVVVVTLNYRQGVFGYLAHPDLTKESPLASSGNYGLLDIISALRWVQSNIDGFGGDPGNVTIAGQSAGGIAVNQLLAAPLAKGLFHRAIAESGPTLGLKMAPLEAVERGGVTFAQRVKPASIAQLRSMAAQDVFTTFRGPVNPLPPFFPLPVLDGKVVTSDPEIPTNPIVSPVPLIVGFNRDETEAAPTTAIQFATKVKAAYGPFADRVLAAYPHATDAEATASAAELARDRQFTGLLDWAERRASTSGQRVYVYRFDHPYPGADPKRFGAFHTAEVPYVFGTLPSSAASADPKVADEIQERWIAFMRTGDPSVPGKRWPDIARARGRAMHLGDVHGMAAPVSSETRLALLREYLAQTTPK